MKVVVIGPGLMGSQIGVEYLLAGHDVLFVGRRRDVSANRIGDALGLADEFDLASAAAIASIIPTARSDRTRGFTPAEQA